VTDKALAHLRQLRAGKPQGADMTLRIGVKSGGCSGMSYLMEFENAADVKDDDAGLYVSRTTRHVSEMRLTPSCTQ